MKTLLRTLSQKPSNLKVLLQGMTLALVVLASAANAASVKVERVAFPVTLSNGFSTSIVGYFYHHGGNRHRTIQVLVHGGTYDHQYWDFPTINGNSYSYARYMVAQGYSVLALDMLGSGESHRPNGDFLTVDELARSLHQVMQHLRNATAGVKHPAEKLVLVGHSIGASASIVAQALYHDADALITTGLGHVYHEIPLRDLLPHLAQFEYFPLPAPVRGFLFYSAPHADPDVIAHDLANCSGLISRGQLFTIFTTLFDPVASRTTSVTGPVLVQLGEHDVLFPSSLAGGEAAAWPSADVTIQALSDVGHDFNTHFDRQTGWAQIDAWIQNLE